MNYPPPPYHQNQPHDDGKAGGVVVAGYIFAVLMPIIGLILGIIAATRPNKSTSKHGVWIIVLSAVIFAIAFAALSSQSSTSSYNGY